MPRSHARHLFVLCAVFLSLVPGSVAAFAAASADSDTTDSMVESITQYVRPKLRYGGFILLPKVYYSSETSVGIGGQILRPFRLHGDGEDADSDIGLKGRATFKGQGEVGAELNLGWGESPTYSSRAKVEFTNIPRRYYGIGPDTPESNEEVFQPQSVLFYVEGFRRVFGRLRVGLRAEVERVRLLDTRPGGLLDTQPIPGTENSQVIGWGVLWDWDSRDDRYWPTRGSLHQSFFMQFDDALKGDHNFDIYYLDLRRYITTAENHVLALQGFVYAVEGGAPFWRLASLGGRSHSRGYQKGRYRDNALLAAQAEHRFPVWRRLGLVGFAGLAVVGPAVDEMEWGNVRPTFGGGIRLRLGSREWVNARLDLAFGGETPRIYFKLGESF